MEKDEKKTSVPNIEEIKRFISTRYILIIMSFYAVLNSYVNRVNMTIAIVAIVGNPEVSKLKMPRTGTVCLELKNQLSNATLKQFRGDLHWSEIEQGYVLGGHYYGMMFTLIPLSILTTKIHNAKWMLAWAEFIIALLSFAIPVSAYWSVYAVIVIKISQGFAMGVEYPAIFLLMGNWIPKQERSRANGLIFSGIALGTMATYSLSGEIINSGFLGGWPPVFYLSGLSALIWFSLWICLVYESPSEHVFITKKELEYISQGQDHIPELKVTSIPWKAIFTSVPVWALIVTQFCNNWGFFTLITQMPKYLQEVLFFRIETNGFLSSLPHITGLVFTICSSFMADFLIKMERLSKSTIRKIISSMGFFLPATCLFLVPIMGCRPYPIIALLTLSNGFSSMHLCGYVVSHLDMAPRFSGILFAITGTVGNISGILAPIYAGWINTNGHTLESWRTIFITSGVISIVGGITYDVFCTSEPQPWGHVNVTNKENCADSTDSVEKPKNETSSTKSEECASTLQDKTIAENEKPNG